MSKRRTASESLRDALRNAEQTRYRISQETGIPQGNLANLMRGRRWLNVENFDLLCEYLGLELVPKKSEG